MPKENFVEGYWVARRSSKAREMDSEEAEEAGRAHRAMASSVPTAAGLSAGPHPAAGAGPAPPELCGCLCFFFVFWGFFVSPASDSKSGCNNQLAHFQIPCLHSGCRRSEEQRLFGYWVGGWAKCDNCPPRSYWSICREPNSLHLILSELVAWIAFYDSGHWG